MTPTTDLELAARRAMFAAALLALAGVPAALEAQSADREALRRLKTVDWPRAYRTQDVALLDRILADDFRMIRTDGGWSSKREELERIRANRPAYDSLVFQVTRLESIRTEPPWWLARGWCTRVRVPDPQ